jgi:cytochrome c2
MERLTQSSSVIVKGRILIYCLLLLAALLFSVRALQANNSSDGGQKFSAEAAAIFNRRCTACHTYGKGIKVGPDLKGVTGRRTHDWLLKFIRASSMVIKSGDPTATKLFAEFKGQRMPDWTDLSENQITGILDYLTLGGPDIKPADEKNAETATPAEIEKGRELFYGEARLKNGGQPCVACHTTARAAWRGGSLGPDLTNVYVRYQDLALTEFLRHPCFTWDTGNSSAQYLSAQESFAIKSFLRQAALKQSTPKTPAKTAPVLAEAP